jgi:S-formylglutathione hydrolase FrmB
MVGALKRLLFVPGIAFLCLASGPPCVHAQSRIDCSALNSRILHQAVHYCVLLPRGYAARGTKDSARRYPVLYFLHGLGEDERTLFDTGGWNLIEDLRQQHKIGNFLIVAPEGRRTFFINSADGKVPYSDFFLREFMPFIQRKYRVRPGRAGRAVSGVSMGGYGALRMAFAHPELFSAVSAESAALITDSPQEINAAMHAGSPLGRLLGDVFGRPINLSHWRANSPFVLAKEHKAGLRKLAIYFNCGREDDYGFEQGAEALHRQLESEGIPHEYHLYPGGHSMTYFLAHIGETLEFHSRVFEKQK